MKPAFLAAAALATLAACAPAPEPDATPQPVGDCSLPYQNMVGVKVAASILPATLNHRVILPGQVVTQDYQPDRVNFEVDRGGVIERVFCG